MFKHLTQITNILSAVVEKYGIWMLIILWFVVQSLLYWKYGVRLVPDSNLRYIPYATQVIETGQLGVSQENRYIVYISFLVLFMKVNAGMKSVVLAQVVVAGIAAALFYKSVKLLTAGNTLMAFAATALLITWKDIQYHNFYILTESLFTSFIIFVMYALIRSKNGYGYTFTLALCALPILLRPNGFIVLLGASAFLAYQYRYSLFRHQKLIIFGAITAFILLIIVLDKYLLTTFEIVETYARGEVIYATDIFSIPSSGVVLPQEKDSPILRILFFIFQNPIFFFKLFFLKLLLYIAYVKPYYSLFHNLSIVLIIYPLYFFSGWYIYKGSNHSLKLFAIVVFVLQALIVAATSEDWDSRFIIPFLPVFILLGTTGIAEFRVNRRLTQVDKIY